MGNWVDMQGEHINRVLGILAWQETSTLNILKDKNQPPQAIRCSFTPSMLMR